MTDMEQPLTLSLTPGAGLLTLDPAELLRGHTFAQGATRAGKSWLLRWLCEQTFGRAQQLVLDVEGEYVSLTERFDYALFSADTPVRLDPAGAAGLIRRLLELGTSAIFDLSGLTTEAQQEWTRQAAVELVRATTKAPRPVLIVIDEAQRLAPQAGQGEATSTGAVRDLANRGLKRGLALLLASQRHSAVDASVRGAMANLLVGGTPPGTDMESVGKKLGFDARERRRLADLRRGDFFVLGPAFGDPDGPRRVLLARSGTIQTRHMDAGEARAYTPPPASEAVQSLYEQLGHEQAGERPPPDPSAPAGPAPRAAPAERIVEVEKIVEKVVEVERLVEVPVFREGEVARLGALADDMVALGKDLLAGGQEIRAKIKLRAEIETRVEGQVETPAAAAPPPPVAEDMEPKPPPPVPPVPAPATPDDLPAAKRKILATLAEFEALGVPVPARAHVAVFAGASPTSGAYNKNLTELSGAGLLSYPRPGLLGLTPAGRRRATPAARHLTRAMLHDAWLKRLPDAQQRLLRVLIVQFPAALPRAALAARVGASPTSGAYNKNLTELKDLGLARYPRAGQVAATELLFPKGLPG